jgi:hypothetical protein
LHHVAEFFDAQDSGGIMGHIPEERIRLSICNNEGCSGAKRDVLNKLKEGRHCAQIHRWIDRRRRTTGDHTSKDGDHSVFRLGHHQYYGRPWWYLPAQERAGEPPAVLHQFTVGMVRKSASNVGELHTDILSVLDLAQRFENGPHQYS